MRAYTSEASGNGAKAAALAGYAKANARAQASRLLTKANIRAAIANIEHKAEAASIADARERRELLTTFARNPNEHPLARLRAIDIQNKMDGLYVQKHEHGGVDGNPIQVITGVPQPEAHA